MWHEDNLGTKEGCGTDIFDNVIVVADEDAACPAFDVKDCELVPGDKCSFINGCSLRCLAMNPLGPTQT